ncbi:hypothetical protein NGB36_18590 [Streptomyces sp. RB6PN25]|uniref:Uncharacterized protein n=1 Tax=Streptomyces humicola TaxID=2953240 RepID=A0ABT1PZS1_9ACTN|nr:hypothetical protein [Streptomyces humicola]MCQ4082555.1 hypothetical protein [Streptomyces humicola]
MTAEEPPEVGAIVWDTARDLMGVVVAVDDMLVRLRVAGGGATWRARLADVCRACPMDELRTRVTEINACHVWSR